MYKCKEKHTYMKTEACAQRKIQASGEWDTHLKSRTHACKKSNMHPKSGTYGQRAEHAPRTRPAGVEQDIYAKSGTHAQKVGHACKGRSIHAKSETCCKKEQDMYAKSGTCT